MTTWNRFNYAFCITVIMTGIMTVVIMISGLDIGEAVFSNYFAVPVLVVAYLLAPLLERYVKLK